MGSMKKWMLGAAMVAGTSGHGRSARPGSSFWNLRWRTGGLRSALPRTRICLGRRLLGQWLLGAGLLELRRVGGPVIRGGVVIGRGPVYGRHIAPEHFRR